MNLEYQLTFEDYQEATKLHLKLHPLQNIFSLIMSVFFIATGLIRTDYFILFLGTFLIVLIPLLKNKSIFQAWKNQPQLQEPVSLEVTEEQLIFKSSNYKLTYNWQYFTHFVETKNIILTYEADQLMNIIPKSSFSSHEQLHEFLEKLASNVKKHPVKA